MKEEFLKIAICDDNQADIEYVKQMVISWAEDRSVKINTFGSAEEFLFHYDGEKDYDILLLDVEMGKIDGVTMAKKIRRGNDTIQIVFITGYSDYIADGYDVAALHYLLKPVKKDQLFKVLDRAVENLNKNEKEIIIKTAGEIYVIPINEIKYVEVRQNYITIHGKQDITNKQTLQAFAKELDDRFYKLGRSYIINLNYIRRITRTEAVLSTGEEIPLPRGVYDGLNRAIIDRV